MLFPCSLPRLPGSDVSLPWLPLRASPYSMAVYIASLEESQISCWLSACFHMLPEATVPVHIFCKAGNPRRCWQIFGSDCVLLYWTAQVPKCYDSKGKRWKSYVSIEDVICVKGFLSEWLWCPAGNRYRIHCLLTWTSPLLCAASSELFCWLADKAVLLLS